MSTTLVIAGASVRGAAFSAIRDPAKHGMSTTLVIAGASVRGAAFSALRGGLTPYAADLFADADLVACCRAKRVDHYPRGLREAIRDFPAGPWMYAGALENRPDLVDAMASERPLLGNAGAVLKNVRDLQLVRLAAAEAGWHVPATRATARGLPRDGTWVCKRVSSAGGAHVRRWTPEVQTWEAEPGWHFQEFVPGEPWSALYVAAKGEARLLGATEQLLAGEQNAAAPFRYEGSVGPATPSPPLQRRLERLGHALATAFDLQGVFGVDLAVRADTASAIEINPRYPASAEIIERATGASIVSLHVEACREGRLPSPRDHATTALWHGKRILFATSLGRVPQAWHDRQMAACATGWPLAADIPPAGATLVPNQPIATAFAAGATRAEVVRQLNATLTSWRGELGQA